MAVLEGKIAVVSGGAAGIGGGITRSLAGAGAHVVVNDIDADLLAGTVEAVTDAGGKVTPLHGDIRDPAVVSALADLARSVAAEAGAAGAAGAAGDAGTAEGGGIDVLVNNVGDYRPNGRFLKTTEADWQALYALNLEHVFRLTHAVAPSMVAQGSGSIVNVSTVEAFRGIPANAVYSAFNAGINAFTKSMAVELGRDGVRVNAIAPDLADTLQTPAEVMLRGRPPEMTRHWLPLGRFGQPDDYGDVVLFLASDQARFVTGHVIPVDGGTTAASGWYLRSDQRGWTNLPDHP